jgi:hypothetical protein
MQTKTVNLKQKFLSHFEKQTVGMSDGYCSTCEFYPGRVSFQEFEEAFQEHVTATWPCPEYILTKGFTQYPSQDIFTETLQDDGALFGIFCKFCGNILSEWEPYILPDPVHIDEDQFSRVVRDCEEHCPELAPVAKHIERRRHGKNASKKPAEKVRLPQIQGPDVGKRLPKRSTVRSTHPYHHHERELKSVAPPVMLPDKRRNRNGSEKRVRKYTKKVYPKN